MERKLTTHQQEVFEEIVNTIEGNLFTFDKRKDINDRLLSLTGQAGTGKSVLTTKITKYIIDKLNANNCYSNDSIVVTAPTHKATSVLRNMLLADDIKAECKTIYSFLNIEPIYDYNTGEEKFAVARGKHTPAAASLLVIDESSMISEELYKLILETITTGKVNTILFIGDPFQLLPVDNSDENEVFKIKKQFELTQIVRQAENSPIIKLATKVRNMIETQKFGDLNKLIKESKSDDIELFESREEFLESFYENDQWYKEDKIISSFTNNQVDNFNKDVRVRFWEERGINNPAHFLASDMIRFKKALIENGFFKDNNRTIYSNNQEVMLNHAELVDTGKDGLRFWKCTVVGRKYTDFIRIIDPDSELLYNEKLEGLANLAKTTKYPYKMGFWKDYHQLKNAFANVQYVYAATIHKLQGSSYNFAYIDLASLLHNKHILDDMKFRLVYVAITRAKLGLKILY
ncbi:ATP-dependent DNA helicase [Candidatus Sulfurimonas baltica]|uniref:AAA family ATPase n=1 Tax=Candidatus Sulfurimonas baltica TaxID=2740404 RepID=A0A7S7LTP9_9BACT|nr:AAA family ATPase [Candidatus Sulfurimonas baltica]QOY51362.1 AAA family ATPase [Candidatus Sulfurimonas baltica]